MSQPQEIITRKLSINATTHIHVTSETKSGSVKIELIKGNETMEILMDTTQTTHLDGMLTKARNESLKQQTHSGDWRDR